MQISRYILYELNAPPLYEWKLSSIGRMSRMVGINHPGRDHLSDEDCQGFLTDDKQSVHCDTFSFNCKKSWSRMEIQQIRRVVSDGNPYCYEKKYALPHRTSTITHTSMPDGCQVCNNSICSHLLFFVVYERKSPHCCTLFVHSIALRYINAAKNIFPVLFWFMFYQFSRKNPVIHWPVLLRAAWWRHQIETFSA